MDLKTKFEKISIEINRDDFNEKFTEEEQDRFTDLEMDHKERFKKEDISFINSLYSRIK